MISTLASLKSV